MPEAGPKGTGVGVVERAPERARRLRRPPRRRRSRAAGSTACTSWSTAGTAPRSGPRPWRCAPSVPRSRCSTRRPTARTSTRAAVPRIPRSSRRRCWRRTREIGLAFDGDADRVIAVDEQGELVDGDQIIAITAHRPPRPRAAAGQRRRRHRDVEPRVASGRSTPYGIELVETPVGDRNVLDELERRDLALGGEQSGHVIYADHADHRRRHAHRDRPARRDGAPGPPALGAGGGDDPAPAGAPQRRRRRSRCARSDDAAFWSRVRDVDDELGDDGRVLVRPSGTEPLVRVMVEAVDLAERRSGSRSPRRADRARGAREVRVRPLDLLTMCGIVGVVRRRARRTPPDPTALAADLVEALAVLNSNAPLGDRLGSTATLVAAVDSALRGAAGVRARRSATPNVAAAARRPARCPLAPARRDRARARPRCRGGDRARRRSRLVNVVAGPCPRRGLGGSAATASRTAEAIAALEPRIRRGDRRATSRCRSRSRRSTGSRSAAATPPGCIVLVRDHGLDLDDRRRARAARRPRRRSALHARGRCGSAPNCLSFVYKAAAEIGELGDNTAVLRAAIRDDELLRPRPRVGRPPRWWCSGTRAGRASASSPRPNAHPLNQEELGRRDRALRGRRAQRRRRQLRRPQGAREPASSRPRSPPTPR